jgi:hypothetical protein
MPPTPRFALPLAMGFVLAGIALAACSAIDPNPPDPHAIDPVPPDPHAQPDPLTVNHEASDAASDTEAGL